MKFFGSSLDIRDNLNVAFFGKKLSNLSWQLPQKRIAPLLYLVINMTDSLSRVCVEVAVSLSNSLGKAVQRLVSTQYMSTFFWTHLLTGSIFKGHVLYIFIGCLVLINLSQISGCNGYLNRKWFIMLFFKYNQIRQTKFLKSWKMAK